VRMRRGTQHGCDTRTGARHGATSLTRDPVLAWASDGPVQAEVFVLRVRAGTPELVGRCGPDPWYIEVGPNDDPVDVVTGLSRSLMGDPLLVHSTS